MYFYVTKYAALQKMLSLIRSNEHFFFVIRFTYLNISNHSDLQNYWYPGKNVLNAFK